MKVKFKKVREVPTPIYATEGAAAMDLYAATESEYNTQDNYYEYDTGIAIEVPEGHGALVLPRSSISTKGIILANSIGLIDSDFRASIKVRVKPVDEAFSLYRKGERIAQLLIIPTPRIELVEVDDLTSTQRGEGGFGSSGLN
jgi:dUTP pyrophosphatase